MGKILEKDYSDGEKITYYYDDEGKYHREDGPAVKFSSGPEQWYFHGMRHREDGPAVIFSWGGKMWWYCGQHIECSSQEEFERIVNLLLFE